MENSDNGIPCSGVEPLAFIRRGNQWSKKNRIPQGPYEQGQKSTSATNQDEINTSINSTAENSTNSMVENTTINLANPMVEIMANTTIDSANITVEVPPNTTIKILTTAMIEFAANTTIKIPINTTIKFSADSKNNNATNKRKK
jgi:hypothetical protein